MAKFKYNSFFDDDPKPEEPLPGQTELNFDDSSKKEETNAPMGDYQITMIPRRRIKVNEINRKIYTIGEVQDLAWSIRYCGLIQPLQVLMPDEYGNYKLLGGERRLTAIDTLIRDPDVPEWTEDVEIPCVVTDLGKIDLPLDNDSKEIFSVIMTNSTARKYTGAEKMMELRYWNKIIDELKENGVQNLPISRDGEELTVNLETGKREEQLSQVTGMSRGEIARIGFVEKHASEEVMDAFCDMDDDHSPMTVGAAYNIVRGADGSIDEASQKKRLDSYIRRARKSAGADDAEADDQMPTIPAPEEASKTVNEDELVKIIQDAFGKSGKKEIVFEGRKGFQFDKALRVLINAIEKG